MTTDITELAQSLKAAAEKATPGPWYVHDKPCEDGNYGIDTSDEEFLAEAVVWWGFARQSIWREEDAKYIALANPANIRALVEALEKAQSKLDKIKSNSCHVYTLDEVFIPNSLDAWGRPVPQYLPYDFSGNPGASATQYCNGWNDAGGYWLNYVRELESRTVKLPEPFKLAKSSSGLTYYYADEVNEALSAAGIKWETE